MDNCPFRSTSSGGVFISSKIFGARERTNVDAALTPEPQRDPWSDDCDELTEDTPKSTLTWGPGADDYFAAAHAIGAALRKLRRQQRPEVEQEPPSCKPQDTHEFDFDATMQKIDNGEPFDYYDFLEVLKVTVKGKRPRIPANVPAEWREPPGFPNYLLHSVTRELWRQAYEITLPNGSVRRYPAKVQKPHNGSFSVSVGGVKSSRGVQALWEATFPEHKRRKSTGGARLDHEDFGRNLPGTWDGTAEWISGGGVGVTTRP